MNRTMPAQRPGQSKQDYGTPRIFLDAVERRYGKILFDLAAHSKNAVVPRFFSKEQNSLVQDWAKIKGNRWLNPEFADIAPWAAKCAAYRERDLGRTLFLVPASIGAQWFADHVHGKALVLGLTGRLSFDGKNPYPKDCMLCVYGERPGFDIWDWRVG